ncbi:MAG TPA: TRAP transporter substrate-binding protein DctP [Burkholderiales bacterium]|jgi:TRAP-type transport system periplasmic protein|nr:TRAP transporter substrate-binding protein DctP [Burkholderiales bacterium]
MMRMLKAAAAAAAALAAGVAAAQETTLNAVLFVPRNTTFGEIFVRFVEHVNREGKGLVQVKLIGGPDAIPTFEQGNAVKTGVVDMASVAPTFYTNFCPECDAQILAPLQTPRLKKTPFWTALDKYTVQKVNAHLLSAYGDGIGFHIWTNKPVPSAGSFKGMRLRTTPNYQPLFAALGATQMQTAPGEVLTALERGVVDGYGWPGIGMFDMGWGPHTKFRIDPSFYNVVVNVLVNLDKWKSLREDQRAFLNRMADWLETENVRWVADRKAADDKRIKDAGIQVVDLGPGHRKLAYDAYWEALAKRAPEPIKELRAASDALR